MLDKVIRQDAGDDFPAYNVSLRFSSDETGGLHNVNINIMNTTTLKDKIENRFCIFIKDLQ